MDLGFTFDDLLPVMGQAGTLGLLKADASTQYTPDFLFIFAEEVVREILNGDPTAWNYSVHPDGFDGLESRSDTIYLPDRHRMTVVCGILSYALLGDGNMETLAEGFHARFKAKIKGL